MLKKKNVHHLHKVWHTHMPLCFNWVNNQNGLSWKAAVKYSDVTGIQQT